MKKVSLVLAVIMALAVMLAACSGGASSATPAAGGGDADGVLTMATEATFRPYEYMSGDEVVGVDIDIAREIAAEMGLELEISEMPFDAILAAVATGKADFGAAGISVTPERAETVDFSIEYATSMQVILTKGDSGITGEADLDGKTVGVQLGTVADIVLSEDYPNVTLQQYNRYSDALSDLMGGRLDALVLDSLPAIEMQRTDASLVICEDELFTDVYAICVQKGNTEMLEAINTVLTRLMQEGKIEEFTQNHLSE